MLFVILYALYQFVMFFNLLAPSQPTFSSNGSIFWEDKMSVLQELRPQIFQFLVQDYMKADAYLARYLQICSFEVKCAAERIQNSYKWRTENNISEVHNENFDELKLDFPHLLNGTTRSGDPIAEVYAGKWDLRKYVSAGKQGLLMRYAYQLVEEMEIRLYEISQRQTLRGDRPQFHQVYALVDPDGYSFRKIACYGCVGMITDMVKIQGLHYPYILKHAIIINTPMIFGPLISLVKSLVDPDTAKVIQDYGHDKDVWLPKILEDVDLGQISKAFGGTLE